MSTGFWGALKKASRRGRRKGWLAILWNALVMWLRPLVRGAAGERLLEWRLRVALAGTGAAVKGPFMVYRRDGKTTTELDGLVIAPTGIFVLEAKTYKGEIVGGAGDAEWTQVLGRRHRKFQNPLHQNYGHRREIARIVGPRLERAVHQIVAFSGEATFREERPAGVMDFADVAGHIMGWNTRRRLSKSDIAEAKRIVDAAEAAVTREDRKKHVERLKKRHGRA